MQPEKIRYIKETGEFLVNNSIIKESSLTKAELKKLKSKAKQSQLITNQVVSEGALII